MSAIVPAPTMITDRMTVRVHRLILFCYTSISKIVQYGVERMRGYGGVSLHIIRRWEREGTVEGKIVYHRNTHSRVILQRFGIEMYHMLPLGRTSMLMVMTLEKWECR